MARTELRVTVLGARDLKRDERSGSRQMSVYSLLWIDPALKLATRMHVEGGRHPVWNDEMVFSLGEDVPLLPHSAIAIKVVSGIRSEGSWRNTLLGTTYLPLRDVATMKAMRENPEDADIVHLQLITPGGHAQGSIGLSISLIDSSRRRGLSNMAPPLSNQSIQPTMGYPVGFRQPTPYEVHQQASNGDIELAHLADNFQAFASSGHWNFPVGLSQSGGALPSYCPGQEGSSAYIQTPQPYWPWQDQSTRLQRRRNMTLVLIVGAVAGFVIGDILGVFFR